MTTETTAGHTPGPWKVDEAIDLPMAVIEDTPEGYGICEIDNVLNEDKQQAVARLIAAAPDLLVALEKIKSITADGVVIRNETGKPQWSALDEMAKIAQAAIAQAEGK